MMKTTQTRTGNQGRFRTRLLFDGPAIRRILAETVVNAVLVEVGNVIADQPQTASPWSPRAYGMVAG